MYVLLHTLTPASLPPKTQLIFRQNSNKLSRLNPTIVQSLQPLPHLQSHLTPTAPSHLLLRPHHGTPHPSWPVETKTLEVAGSGSVMPSIMAEDPHRPDSPEHSGRVHRHFDKAAGADLGRTGPAGRGQADNGRTSQKARMRMERVAYRVLRHFRPMGEGGCGVMEL